MTDKQLLCYSTLSSQALAFGKANASIVQLCGHDAGIVVNALIDLHLAWGIPASEGMEVSVEQLRHRTMLTKYKQANALKALSGRGMVQVVAMGKGKRRHITLDFERILAIITGNFPSVLHCFDLKNDDEEILYEKKSASPVSQGVPGSAPKKSSQGEFTLTTYPEWTEDETTYLQGFLENDGAFNLTGFREFLLTGASEYCKTTKRELDDFGVHHQLTLIQLFLAGYHGIHHQIVYPMRWLQTFPFDANGRFNQTTDNGYGEVIRLAAWYAGQLSQKERVIVYHEVEKLQCETIYAGLLQPPVCDRLHQLKTFWEERHGSNGETITPKDAAPRR